MNDEAGDVVDEDEDDVARIFVKFSIEKCNLFDALEMNFIYQDINLWTKMFRYFWLTVCNQMTEDQDYRQELLSIRNIPCCYHSAEKKIIHEFSRF